MMLKVTCITLALVAVSLANPAPAKIFIKASSDAQIAAMGIPLTAERHPAVQAATPFHAPDGRHTRWPMTPEHHGNFFGDNDDHKTVVPQDKPALFHFPLGNPDDTWRSNSGVQEAGVPMTVENFTDEERAEVDAHIEMTAAQADRNAIDFPKPETKGTENDEEIMIDKTGMYKVRMDSAGEITSKRLIASFAGINHPHFNIHM